MPKRDYSREFSEQRFWDKLKSYAKWAGRDVVERALILWYAAQQPHAPLWAKTAIYGALGYFILPMDAIPDVLPDVGYSDDLGVLAAALGSVALYIDEDVKRRAVQSFATGLATKVAPIRWAEPY